MKQNVVIVVPCFNEERRLDIDAFAKFCHVNNDIHFIFVNDGSYDNTLGVITRASQDLPGSVCVIDLPVNMGKAEAVRRGMLAAIETSSDYIGYWDADLSTPLESIIEFRNILHTRPDITLVMGARVQLLGRRVERSALRHYVGRIFATAASFVLRLDVYDTQCGAKLLRNSNLMYDVFSRPFSSKWIFDVELIARMQKYTDDNPKGASIYEYPLVEWIDRKGSKVGVRAYLRSAIDLARIYNDCR